MGVVLFGGGVHDSDLLMRILVMIVFCVTGMVAWAQSAVKITPAEAKEHIGTNVIVVGTIAEVSKAEKLVRLNFEKPFPKQPLTAVIFANKTNLFPEVEKLKGKEVQVSGKIAAFKERPEIVITSTNQLKVLEDKAAEGSRQ